MGLDERGGGKANEARPRTGYLLTKVVAVCFGLVSVRSVTLDPVSDRCLGLLHSITLLSRASAETLQHLPKAASGSSFRKPNIDDTRLFVIRGFRDYLTY